MLFVGMNFGALAVPIADAALIPSANGMTVRDTVMHVTWLANANLPGTPAGRFGVANIKPNGAMDYATALEWVAASRRRAARH